MVGSGNLVGEDTTWGIVYAKPQTGILVAGSLSKDAALIKVEADSGETLWTQTWDLGSEDAFEGVALSEDGSILLTGYRDGLAEGTFLNWGRGVAVKTDASGKEIWLRDLSKFTSSGYRIRALGQGSLVALPSKGRGVRGIQPAASRSKWKGGMGQDLRGDLLGV